MDATPIHLNGINAVTGTYGLTLTADELVKSVFDKANRAERQREFNQAVKDRQRETVRGVRWDVDGTKLDEAGWGIIFAYGDGRTAAIQEALSPLLALRKTQAGDYYREFTDLDAYRPSETKREFLKRFGIGTGPVDPRKGVPYYLLLIGSPEQVPYAVQFELDVQFAVGRLDFDTVEEYATYAQSVVTAEVGPSAADEPLRAPTAAFFSVTNSDDSATASTDQNLVQPLIDTFSPAPAGWQIDQYRGDAATRSQLQSLLGGPQKPALLFTASHGVEFPMGHARQEAHQGALLCNGWSGPKKSAGPLGEDHYLAGEHLPDSADPSGLIAFHFACYGGGTPQYFDYGYTSAGASPDARRQIAQRSFTAHLPKRLLGHPRGGALAVVSHVDRALSFSYMQGKTPQTTVFEDVLKILFAGKPLGWALEQFDSRYAELAADLSNAIDRMNWGVTANPYDLAILWTENHDARNYVVLGDPAVRVAGGHVPGVEKRVGTIATYPDGRPVTVSSREWAQTPPTVRQVLRDALQKIEQLRQDVAQTAAVAKQERPVYRDGGRSGGGTLRSATTRRGGARGRGAGDGTLRSGTIRGGATRSENRSTTDDETAQ